MQEHNLKISLAISGGGFRATLFHLGVIKRLTELGLFENIKTISSVSGGSVLNGLIGLKYDSLNSIPDFEREIENDIVGFTKINLRNQVLRNILLRTLFKNWFPQNSIEKFSDLLNQYLFKGKTLGELSKNTRIIFNTTNLLNGARFKFEQGEFGDYKTGYSYDIKFFNISDAVTASAAFPLLFSPFKLKTKNYTFYSRNWKGGTEKKNSNIPPNIYLTDGGIYDNLGLNPIFNEIKKEPDRFVIVSDAPRLFDETYKKFSFLSQIKRCHDITSEQSIIKNRKLIFNDFVNKSCKGIYFSLAKNCNHYREYKNDNIEVPTKAEDIPQEIGWSEAEVNLLNKVRTDLDAFHQITIDYLIYHGASLCDVQLRKWHPEIYSQLPNIPLKKPQYDLNEVKRVLEEASKNKL